MPAEHEEEGSIPFRRTFFIFGRVTVMLSHAAGEILWACRKLPIIVKQIRAWMTRKVNEEEFLRELAKSFRDARTLRSRLVNEIELSERDLEELRRIAQELPDFDFPAVGNVVSLRRCRRTG